MSEPVLLVEVADGVARVTLNRPEVRNALNEALLRAGGDPAPPRGRSGRAGRRAARGRGASVLAGADLNRVADRGTTLQARESFGGLGRSLEHMARMRTPVIAQVDGYAESVPRVARRGGGVSEPVLLLEVADRPILRMVGRKRRLLLITRVALSDDAREGIAAFFEKRPPRFTGR